jgi:hypothetical protein
MSKYIVRIHRKAKKVKAKFNAKKLAKQFVEDMESYYDDLKKTIVSESEQKEFIFDWNFCETRCDYFADRMILKDWQWEKVQVALYKVLKKRFGANPKSQLLST